jgi:hypothetical protein
MTLLPAPKMIMRWEHPDLALYYFWMFPELNISLKGRRFSDVDIPGLAVNSTPEEGFCQCFEQ